MNTSPHISLPAHLRQRADAIFLCSGSNPGGAPTEHVSALGGKNLGAFTIMLLNINMMIGTVSSTSPIIHLFADRNLIGYLLNWRITSQSAGIP